MLPLSPLNQRSVTRARIQIKQTSSRSSSLLRISLQNLVRYFSVLKNTFNRTDETDVYIQNVLTVAFLRKSRVQHRGARRSFKTSQDLLQWRLQRLSFTSRGSYSFAGGTEGRKETQETGQEVASCQKRVKRYGAFTVQFVPTSCSRKLSATTRIW